MPLAKPILDCCSVRKARLTLSTPFPNTILLGGSTVASTVRCTAHTQLRLRLQPAAPMPGAMQQATHELPPAHHHQPPMWWLVLRKALLLLGCPAQEPPPYQNPRSPPSQDPWRPWSGQPRHHCHHHCQIAVPRRLLREGCRPRHRVPASLACRALPGRTSAARRSDYPWALNRPSVFLGTVVTLHPLQRQRHPSTRSFLQDLAG